MDEIELQRKRNAGELCSIEFWQNTELLIPSINREDLLTKLPIIFSVLEKVFPDNWTISYIKVSEVIMPKIIVYFPEVNLKTEDDMIYPIKGLLISVEFKFSTNTANLFPSLEGARTYKSYLEFINGYQHSHLHSIYAPTVNPLNFSTFCLGESEIIDVFKHLEDIKVEKDNQDSIEEYQNVFEMLCIMIKIHAETESVSGGAYSYYKDLKGLSTKLWKDQSVSISQSASNVMSYMLEHQTLSVDIVYQGNIFKIKDNKKFEDCVKEALIAINNYTMFVTINPVDKQEYVYNINRPNTEIIQKILKENYHIYIQGRRINLDIELPEIVEDDIRNYKIAKIFLEHVKNKIEEQINRAVTRNTVVRKYNKTILEKRNYRKNSVSV